MLLSTFARSVGILGLAASQASFGPLDPFVSAGEYARSRRAAADCAAAWIPARGESPEPTVTFASFARAGAQLRGVYNAHAVDDYTLRVEDAADLPALDANPAGARVESYETASSAVTVLSAPTAAGCLRLALAPASPYIQVGLRRTSVGTSQRFLNRIPAYGRASSCGSSCTVPERAPGSTEVELRLMIDGRPVRNQQVTLWTVGKAPPGVYGRTAAHTHVLNAAQPTPTIRIRGQEVPGQAVRVVTDYEGRARFTVDGGYRGGPEGVIARTSIGGQDFTTARTLVVRHAQFEHFAEAAGFRGGTPSPSESFPFLLVGSTPRHTSNHWLHAGKSAAIVQAFREVWARDADRKASRTPRFWQLNDMSLEYGGLFQISNPHSCSDPSPVQGGRGAPSHATHNVGTDFDVSPCWTEGADGRTRIGASACEAGRGLRVDEQLLAAYVMGGALRASITEHAKTGPGADGVDHHYHIRFDPR